MIIGITGRAGAGKDSLADAITTMTSPGHVQRLRFADPIKKVCAEVFDWGPEQIDGAMKDEPDMRYPRNAPGVYLTPRYAMQKLGTEWGRDCFSDVWVSLVMRKVGAFRGDLSIITDVRFPNEQRAIHERKGIIIKVVRPVTRIGTEHESEQHDIPYDHLIENDGTLIDLQWKWHDLATRLGLHRAFRG